MRSFTGEFYVTVQSEVCVFYCPRDSLKMERSPRVCSNHQRCTNIRSLSALLVNVFILVVSHKTITNVIKDSDLLWPPSRRLCVCV